MSTPWRVPRLWPGRTVAILAGGESMSPQVADAVHAAGLPAIAVNTTHRLTPWADILYGADVEWWQHPDNRDAQAFAGLRVSCQAVPGVFEIRNSGVSGFDPDPGAIRTGGNSGYQALHIALHAGAARVLLCGFDMRGCHWHGPHPAGLKRTSDRTYKTWISRFPALLEAAVCRGVDVVNCTPDSALRCFRMAKLENELAACAQSAATEPALQA